MICGQCGGSGISAASAHSPAETCSCVDRLIASLNDELGACPHCGSRDQCGIIQRKDNLSVCAVMFRVECDCGVCFPFETTPRAAAETWERRAA